MVDTKRYDPTITRFQKHTKSFVSGKTKKGHLSNDERDAGDVVKEDGILVRVNSNNLQGKSWLVKVGNKEYWCTYGDNIVYLPDCVKDGIYYKPKKECKVEVSIDKKSKIYTITRIKDPNKQPISMIDSKISLQGNGNASLTVEENKTAIEGDNLTVENDVLIQTSEEDEDLPDKISVTELYKKVRDIEVQLSDKDDT